MPITIGKKREMTDVVELLLDCHGRIREFVAMTNRLAAGANAPAPEVLEAAIRIRRYFVEALPLHVEDEDRHVSPLLRGRERGLDELLDRMSADHQRHLPLIEELVALCGALMERPGAIGALAPRLGDLGKQIEAEFLAHLEIEEGHIFPALERYVSPDERRRMLEGFRARRSHGHRH